jgi:hypothetical protein
MQGSQLLCEISYDVLIIYRNNPKNNVCSYLCVRWYRRCLVAKVLKVCSCTSTRGSSLIVGRSEAPRFLATEHLIWPIQFD